MQYFIGIVPPEEYLMKVTEFQEKWNKNVGSSIVEPHITVKAQGGLTPDKKWLVKIEQLCKKIGPFEVKLGPPMFFGDQVIFLSVESSELIEVHQEFVYAISPPKELIMKYMELEQYVPHLTLGQTSWGLSSEDLVDMADCAKKELTPYPSFLVNFIRVYEKKCDTKGYNKLLDIELNK